MTDKPEPESADTALPDHTVGTRIDGNLTVDHHSKFTGGDDRSINITHSPGAVVAREVTVILPAAPDKPHHVIDVETYLAAVQEYCANLPYLTLHDIRPPRTLAEVYVPLKARQQPPAQPLGAPAHFQSESASLSIAEVMQTDAVPHILILGEPGAGKSTLLRQLTQHAWDTPQAIGLNAHHLPLLVPLRLLAAATGSLTERLNTVLTNELALPRALPDSFFDDWPDQTGAPWLILLDALDEVPATDRAQLIQWLMGQIRHLREQRVIITSRPAGYQDDFDPKVFGHFDLQPFSALQAGEFARRWFNDQADAFLKELERLGAGDLRGTPLLLTIAARVYAHTGALPMRRSALYLEFVENWLAEANQADRLNAELGERLAAPIGQQLERLAHVAWCMVKQPRGTQLERLCECFAEHLQREENFAPGQARNFGEHFMQIMARRSGVFLQHGADYRFVHPIFLDFLAAYAVVRQSQYVPQTAWWSAISRWAEPNWREVALLALDLLSDQGQDVTVLVRRIWQHGGYYGLYFTWQALLERVNVSEELSVEVIRDMSERVKDFATWNSLRFPDPVQLLCNLSNYPTALESLLNLACDARVLQWIRWRAAEALGQIGDAEPARLAWASVSHDPRMPTQFRKDAAQALSELGTPEDYAQAWLNLVRDARADAWVRIEAASRLGDAELQTVADILVALAGNQKIAARAKIRAIKLLGQSGQAPIVASLGRIAQSNPDKHVRRAAREAAEQIRARLGLNDTPATSRSGPI